jgi:hypothetical protein
MDGFTKLSLLFWWRFLDLSATRRLSQADTTAANICVSFPSELGGYLFDKHEQRNYALECS